MRLTPFRFRSSSGSDSDETSISADVEIYHSNATEFRVEGRDEGEFGTDTPVSMQEVVSVLEDLDTPVTVDEITDRLVHPHGEANVQAWADVHEQLHQEELPGLCEAGVLDFDTARGIVDIAADQDSPSSSDGPTARTVAVTLSIGLGLVTALLLFVPATVATVASIGLVTLGVLTYVLVLFPITP